MEEQKDDYLTELVLITKQARELLERYSPDLVKTAGELATHLITKVLLSPEQYFVCCPTCKEIIFDVEEIPITEGKQEIYCRNNHKHTFNYKTESFEL